MKAFSFTKLSGAGNDFVLFDKKLNPGLALNTEIISSICKRRTGVGADGILVISDAEGYDFTMEYFNADGSTGSLCANGARCAIRYSEMSGRAIGEKVKFTCCGNEYSGEFLGENIKFNLNPPKKLKYNFKIKAYNQMINASYADTGSPHVVINIEDVLENPKNLKLFFKDIDKFPVFDLGNEIRYLQDFTPDGVNVNFIKISEKEILIRSYERGVEDETLSCGTGIAAAALTSYVNLNIKPPVEFKAKSGDKLIVNFSVENNRVRELSLTGPAKAIFNGEISI